MATRNLLSNHFATRDRSLDFTALGLLLPNPDPILKAQGKDVTTYRDMRHDALIGSCITRRKASVQALEWGLDKGVSSSRAAKAVQAVLDALPMTDLIEQMQDCMLYGYQPMEVIWGQAGGLYVPIEVLAKPPEWFCFDSTNMLRFKSRSQPLFGEETPGRKYLLPRQSPTYQNPYGFASLSMCYWPLLFKKGGLKFWLAFTEKFGSAFSVGKLPRNATDAERATLLDSLEALIQNGVATIPDDGSIELVEMAGKSASADLYEKLVAHCSSEIAIALLGQNQTTQAQANKASATAGLEVTKDLRDGDARVIAAAINQLIAWVCEVNFGNVAAPVFSFWDQKEQDQLQAERDKSNYDAGARFTNAYWMRGYGYQEGDLAPEVAPVPAAEAQLPGRVALATAPDASAGATAFADAVPVVDPLQSETDTLMQSTAPQWSAMVDQLQTLVDDATDLGQLQQALVQAYGDLDSTELVKLMAAAMALAELKGLDSARSELPGTAFAEPVAVADPRIDGVAQDVAALRQAVDTLLAKEPLIIHNNILPQQVTVHNQLPEQAAPVVNLAAPNITVQPAPVTVNNTHPAQAIQTVERDANDEIVRTVTTYQAN
jgi:phage gp29-like protein